MRKDNSAHDLYLGYISHPVLIQLVATSTESNNLSHSADAPSVTWSYILRYTWNIIWPYVGHAMMVEIV